MEFIAVRQELKDYEKIHFRILEERSSERNVPQVQKIIRRVKMKAFNIVTIEREYASGGTEIGKLLSKKLDIPAYGNEILEYLAKKLGVSPENLEDHEETKTNSLLYSLYLIAKAYRGENVELSNTDKVNFAEQEIIKELGKEGKCILIGRAANWTLRERDDVLNVFITADKKYRRRRAIKTYGIEEDSAEAVINKFDKRRSSFYRDLTGMNWSEKEGYHMVLNSSKLGLESCADIIADVVNLSKNA